MCSKYGAGVGGLLEGSALQRRGWREGDPAQTSSSVSGRCGECAASAQAYCSEGARMRTILSVTARCRGGGVLYLSHAPQLPNLALAHVLENVMVSASSASERVPYRDDTVLASVHASRRRSSMLRPSRRRKLAPARLQSPRLRHQRDALGRGSCGSESCPVVALTQYPALSSPFHPRSHRRPAPLGFETVPS